ncbi:hypothetical protein X275_09190 [Marinitoga sp. 1197]|uniref:putative signal transducing protein n=1 Tax=unclassified Marinitoga TaxID=2640159 RepID=UPI000640CD25|nr:MULTISPECIES: DUF2007 domain-containing protein [unclassified Marinitoga]KLO21520.1 hypothetical protein X275_09190 [Marinitoga sp. 1197]KLO22591.1 hypothetical protein X274_07770 [Marinitoga sp. 1155]NUU98947.1 hypothetical protein [Marinitoga sp. 1154]
MWKLLKSHINDFEAQLVKQLLESEGISVLVKAPKEIGIGREFFGNGTIMNVFVKENDYENAKEILENKEAD